MIAHDAHAAVASDAPLRVRGAVSLALARRVFGEFLDTPDLKITVSQGQRLFGLEPAECTMVLDCLAEFGILVQLADGRYSRAE